MSPDDLQAALNQEFRASAWGERGKAIVLAPELETWVWSDSPHVAAVAGWAERRPRLRQWLNDHGLWNEQESKPPRPKEAFHAALQASGWRAAHRSTNSSPNEYRSTDAPIVPFMTCAPFCASGFRDNGRKVHEHRLQAPRGNESGTATGLAVACRTIGDPATQSVSDARALLRTDDLPASAAARAVPLFCRLAMEAACARDELYFPGLQIVTPRALIKDE